MTVKKMHPDLSTTLFTDVDPRCNHIDMVKIISTHSARLKQEYLWDSPYENTLYIDSDTGIVGPILESFRLMERFDIAACHDLIRKDDKKSARYPDYADVPDGFPEYAGGVIMFRKSSEVEKFFGEWRKNYKIWYDLTGEVRDQPSFRVSLWKCSELKVYTLPTEFNIRTKKYHNIVPRVYHFHDMNDEKLQKELDKWK
jgi:hypothetical protein